LNTPLPHPITDEEEALFRFLRHVDGAPAATQRDIAAAVGVSLGRLNAQLKTALADGYIATADRNSTDKRQRVAYVLTHKGAAEKARLTDHFLARKFQEYDALHAELKGTASGYVPPNQRTTLMQNNLSPIPELYVSYDSAQKMKMDAADLTSHDLTPRQICDLELLMNGGFNPLKGFLGEDDYNSVVENMRLADGQLWPMPITLDVSEDFAASVELGQDIALRDQEGVILGTMTVTDKYTPNKSREALRFPRPSRHPERTACLFPQDGLASRCGVPNPQPVAPRTPGTDVPGRERSAGQPDHPPRRGPDQARRH